jgi:hypothetical protein
LHDGFKFGYDLVKDRGRRAGVHSYDRQAILTLAHFIDASNCDAGV